MKKFIALSLTALVVSLTVAGLAMMFAAPQDADAAQRHGAPIRVQPRNLVTLSPVHLDTLTLGPNEGRTEYFAGCLGLGDPRVPAGVSSVRVNYTFTANSGAYMQSWPAHTTQTPSLAQVYGVTSAATVMDVKVSPNSSLDACSGEATFIVQGVNPGTKGTLDLTVIGYTP